MKGDEESRTPLKRNNSLRITIKAKVTDDSKAKLQLLEDEHRRFQAYLHGIKEVELYSETKQQADRFLDKVVKHGGKLDPKKEYPLILRRDLIDVKKDSKFDCVYWMKVPVYPKSINLRIQTDCRHDLTQYVLKESKVVRSYGDWYVYITIEKEMKT